MSGSIGQQGLLDYMDFLLTEYAHDIARRNSSTYEDAEGVLKEYAPLMDFRKFAFMYLSQHRPAAITHSETNYVIQLTNSKRFAVAPAPAAVAGTMQPSVAMPVTGVETLREMAANVGGMRGGMAEMGQQQDMRLGSPAFNYNQPKPYQAPRR